MPSSEDQETTSSGTSNRPEIIPYLPILNLDEIPEIKGQFVYVLKGYKEDGISVLIYRNPEDDSVSITISDFDGESLDFSDGNNDLVQAAIEFIQEYSSQFVSLMKSANIPKLIFYISVDGEDKKLVDLRSSINKFYGPGMIRDLFGKIYPTQEIIKVTQLDDDILKAIEAGTGSFEGDIILKCSKFKTIIRESIIYPSYAKIRRTA